MLVEIAELQYWGIVVSGKRSLEIKRDGSEEQNGGM